MTSHNTEESHEASCENGAMAAESALPSPHPEEDATRPPGGSSSASSVTTTTDEAEELRREVERLREENGRLREENGRLQATAAAAAAPGDATVAGDATAAPPNQGQGPSAETASPRSTAATALELEAVVEPSSKGDATATTPTNQSQEPSTETASLSPAPGLELVEAVEPSSKVEGVSVGCDVGSMAGSYPSLLLQRAASEFHQAWFQGRDLRVTMRGKEAFYGKFHAVNLDDPSLPVNKRNTFVVAKVLSGRKPDTLFLPLKHVRHVDVVTNRHRCRTRDWAKRAKRAKLCVNSSDQKEKKKEEDEKEKEKEKEKGEEEEEERRSEANSESAMSEADHKSGQMSDAPTVAVAAAAAMPAATSVAPDSARPDNRTCGKRQRYVDRPCFKDH